MKQIALLTLALTISTAFADTKKEQKQRGYLDLRFAQALGRSPAGRFGNAAQVPSTVKLSPSPQPRKPVRVFQNEPCLPLSKYRKSETRALWWAAGAGSVASIVSGSGTLYLLGKPSIEEAATFAQALGRTLMTGWLRYPLSAVAALAVGGTTFVITYRQVQNHYLKKFTQEGNKKSGTK